jgi:hypothetical protein
MLVQQFLANCRVGRILRFQGGHPLKMGQGCCGGVVNGENGRFWPDHSVQSTESAQVLPSICLRNPVTGPIF